MHSATALSLLALVGSALAVPAPHRIKKVVTKTVVHTKVITHVYGEHSSTPVPEYTPIPVPATSTVIVVVTPKPEPEPSSATPVYTPPPPPPPPSSKPAPVSSAVPEVPPSTGYMAIVDEYRGKLGLKNLIQDATLEKNALKTAVEGNGEMVHQLNPGSFAQVLAPGGPDDFKHCFLGGWLCEMPNLAGIAAECPAASEGWTHTSAGHAEILTSGSYSKIGCGNAGGIWACDLA